MRNEKIDKRLLREIAVLNFVKKVPCFVFAKDFDKTKRHLREQNIHILNEYLFINSFFCTLSQKEIFALSDVRVVDYISSCSNVCAQMYISKKILKVNNFRYTGQGVCVAFIDTGISQHPDFLLGRNRIKFFKDFVSEKTEAYDDNGHGTFVAGVCSGCGAMSGFKFSGIAPKTDIVALKALNGAGESGANKILSAMEWLFDNHKKFDIRLVCMSFGSEPIGVNDPIMLGADALWKEGVAVIAAAGNSGPEYQTIKSPGISPKIITVGGIDDNRYDENTFNPNFFEIADFSSRGPAMKKVKPDVVAPSVDIISCGRNKLYTTLSGTSVATPMIAGLACLMLEKEKTLSPNEIKNNLLENCNPLGFERNLEGFGMPNLSKLFIR